VPEPEADIAQTATRIVRIIIRRRWWILSTIAGSVVVTWIVLSQLPSRYTSEATLIAVQPEISTRYVPPSSTMAAADAFQAMTREVLSHSRLLGIIDQFGLYASARRKIPAQRLIELMRRNIVIQELDPNQGHGDFSGFKISFTAEAPQLAAQVTGRLCSLFIEENMNTQARVAASTTTFLNDQLEAKGRKLAEQEERIREFKTRNYADLPDQQQATVAALIDLRAQLQNTIANLAHAQQQRAILMSSLSRSLARLQAEKEGLLLRFTPKYPEVVKKDQEISALEQIVTRWTTEGAAAQARPLIVNDPTLAQTETQLEANSLEVATLTNDAQRLKSAIAQSESRLSRVPEREQQLTAMQREYDLMKQDYTDLKVKQQQSELSADVDRQKEGRHFRLIDPPTLPTIPSSPKRLKISVGGAALGVLLGLALAFLRDMMDRSFRTEGQLGKEFPAPVLVGIPLLLTPDEHRIRKWKGSFEWTAAFLLVTILAAFEVYVYMRS